MRVIKLYEEFQNDIDTICNRYNIRRYTINEDGSVDVNGDIDLVGSGLKKLPLKFNYVSGDFNCSYNKLTTLEGCPKEVGDSFYCVSNQLTSLIGSPESIGDVFDCGSNALITLEGCPTKIGGVFYCNENPVYAIWELINDKEYLEMFIDYDMIEGRDLYLDRLNDIRSMMGKPPVKSVKGYNCI